MSATDPAVSTPAPLPPALMPLSFPATEPPEDRPPFATDQVIAAFWFSADPR